MPRPAEHYVTERNIVDQYEFTNRDERDQFAKKLEIENPTASVTRQSFPNLGKYWISIVIPLTSISEKVKVPVYN